MTIPLTNLHKNRVCDQIRQLLMNTQRDLRNNALAHKAMAQAQSPSLATLQGFVSACALTYLANLQLIIDLRADPVKRQRLLDAIGLMGWTETDITDVVTSLRQAAIGLRDAPRTSYVEISSACDSLLAFVDAPPTLWPE